MKKSSSCPLFTFGREERPFSIFKEWDLYKLAKP